MTMNKLLLYSTNGSVSQVQSGVNKARRKEYTMCDSMYKFKTEQIYSIKGIVGVTAEA